MKKYVGWTLVLSGMILGAVFLGLIGYFSETAPRISQPETDNVYALNNHGTVVYLTYYQNVFLNGTMIAAPLIAVLGAALLSSRAKKK